MAKFDTSFNFGANAAKGKGSKSKKGKSKKGKGGKAPRSWYKKGGGS